MSNSSKQKANVAHGDEPVYYFEFRASLRISGDGLDFDEISRTLDLAPTHQPRKGQQHGRGKRSKDIWIYRPSIERARPLEEHIMALWEAIRPNIPYLRELKRKFHVDVFCGYRSNCETAGFQVDHRCLGLFTELEVPFGFSVIIV